MRGPAAAAHAAAVGGGAGTCGTGELQVTARHLGARRAGQGGFTMIEVLIAIVVMSIGLLGFALLQT
ncbi:prepilin-type N-terminal cleavage/methylation domain-containing protein, partial [Variovorax sp. 2RAF20]